MTHITVPDQTPSLDVAVTTSQSDFAFTFTYFDQTDLRVTVDEVELSQSAFSTVGTPGYEGGYPGGTLTLNVAVSNCQVRIWSQMPPVRVNDFNEGGGFPARAVNTELDRATARLRDMRLRLQRTPVLSFAIDHTLAPEEAGQMFTNKGASGTRTFTLPPASAGLKFTFAVVAAHSLAVAAAGSDTISGGPSLANAAIGSVIVLRAIDSAQWAVESSSGTWA